MFFFNVLQAEWTKLRTTASFWWTSGLFVTFSIGIAAIYGKFAAYAVADDVVQEYHLSPELAVTGINSIGFLLLLIQAVILVSNEYQHNYAAVTFQAIPHRFIVAFAKVLLYAVYAAALTFVCALASMFVTQLLASGSFTSIFSDPQFSRVLWAYPISAVALVVFSVGVSLIIRQGIGAIFLLLLWYFALEQLIRVIPKVGEKVALYGPFTNFNSFITRVDVLRAPWNYEMGLLYFSFWAAALFIIGVVLVERRDV